MGRDREAYMPRELVLRVLAQADEDVVLIGGQALAFWMDHYDVRQPGDLPAISRDVDFFTLNAANSGPLDRFARAIHGRVHKERAESLTALIGSAIAPAADDRIYNVDLLHTVFGFTRDQVEANAVPVAIPGTGKSLRVMHPLHVLQSRNANLHGLAEKQDELGRLQFRLAIEVARRFLEERLDQLDQTRAAPGKQGREALDLVGAVIDYSTRDAAKKNAERYGIFLADAIPAWRIESASFWEKQWPYLRQRMSPGHAQACEQRRTAARR